MLRIKLKELNKNNKILRFLILISFVIYKPLIADESVDIWKNSENKKIEKLEKNSTKTEKENAQD